MTFGDIQAIAPEKFHWFGSLGKTQKNDLQTQLFGLLQDQKGNDGVLVVVESSSTRGISRFFAPVKRGEEYVIQSVPRSSSFRPVPTAFPSIKTDRATSGQVANDGEFADEQFHVPSQAGYSNITPTPSISTMEASAEATIEAKSQPEKWRPRAQERSLSSPKVFEPVPSSFEESRDFGAEITPEDANGKDPPSTSPCLRSQQSNTVHNSTSSIAPLDCSKVRALSEPPTGHCGNSTQSVSLNRRHSLDMVDLSSLAQCSICKKKTFAKETTIDYKW